MGIWYAYKSISKTGVAPYAGDCPPYYDLKGTPWFDKLTENIPVIKDEVLALMTQKNVEMQGYYNTALVETGKWESKPFLVWNILKKLAENEGKEVYNHFKDIPGLVSLSISVLKPGTHVKPHNGDTDATYRMHIPVLIPAGLPECGIKVAGITKPWMRDVIPFCDAHVHEAWNYSKQTRVILIADVVRPEYLAETTKICNEVLAWLLLQQVVQTKVMSVLPLKIKIPIGLMLMAGVRPFFGLLQRSKK